MLISLFMKFFSHNRLRLHEEREGEKHCARKNVIPKNMSFSNFGNVELCKTTLRRASLSLIQPTSRVFSIEIIKSKKGSNPALYPGEFS